MKRKRRVGTKIWAKTLLIALIDTRDYYKEHRIRPVPCKLCRISLNFMERSDCSGCPWTVFSSQSCQGNQLEKTKNKRTNFLGYMEGNADIHIKRLNIWIKKCKEIIEK